MAAFRAGRLQRPPRPAPRGRLPARPPAAPARDGRPAGGRLAPAARRDRRGASSPRPRPAAAAPVVLLHGLGATKEGRRSCPRVAALAPRFRAIAVDLPGLRRLRQADAARAYDAPLLRPRRSSRCSTRSSSSAPTWSATAWAAAWRSSSACATRSGCGGSCCCRPRWPGGATAAGRRCCALVRPELGLAAARAARASSRASCARVDPRRRTRLDRGRRRRVPARRT